MCHLTIYIPIFWRYSKPSINVPLLRSWPLWTSRLTSLLPSFSVLQLVWQRHPFFSSTDAYFPLGSFTVLSGVWLHSQFAIHLQVFWRMCLAAVLYLHLGISNMQEQQNVSTGLCFILHRQVWALQRTLQLLLRLSQWCTTYRSLWGRKLGLGVYW